MRLLDAQDVAAGAQRTLVNNLAHDPPTTFVFQTFDSARKGLNPDEDDLSRFPSLCCTDHDEE